MNQDRIKGQWTQIHGKVKARRCKLTDVDLRIAEGDSEYVTGRLQERYGIVRHDAKRQGEHFAQTL